MEVEVVVGVPRTLLVLVVCHTIDVATGLEPPLNVAVKVIGLLAQRVVSDAVTVIVELAIALTVMAVPRVAARLSIRAETSMTETIF